MLASKFGADCSLLESPENTKLTCWPLVLLELRLLLLLELEEDERRSIQGTATCFPEELLLELESPEELELLPDVPEELPLGLELLPELLGLVLLLDPPKELLPDVPEELPLGLELPPELLEFNDSTAKSILPEFGLIMVSLIVPRVSPVDPVTFAPINWLARKSWCPMRPVALH